MGKVRNLERKQTSAHHKEVEEEREGTSGYQDAAEEAVKEQSSANEEEEVVREQSSARDEEVAKEQSSVRDEEEVAREQSSAQGEEEWNAEGEKANVERWNHCGSSKVVAMVEGGYEKGRDVVVGVTDKVTMATVTGQEAGQEDQATALQHKAQNHCIATINSIIKGWVEALQYLSSTAVKLITNHSEKKK